MNPIVHVVHDAGFRKHVLIRIEFDFDNLHVIGQNLIVNSICNCSILPILIFRFNALPNAAHRIYGHAGHASRTAVDAKTQMRPLPVYFL